MPSSKRESSGREESSRPTKKAPSRAFTTLFGTYAKAINKAYDRSGSLFEKPFHHKLIQNEGYFNCLVAYIHRNPQTHWIVDDFRDWSFSSYQAILSLKAAHTQ